MNTLMKAITRATFLAMACTFTGSFFFRRLSLETGSVLIFTGFNVLNIRCMKVAGSH